MKISIITVSRNNVAGLKKTVQSVLAQRPEIEYIVIDGASTDGSADFLLECQDSLSYWVSEKDAGIYNAMNKGIKRATGDYCMFLNSGDELFNAHTIEKCLASLAAAPQTDIFYGDILLVNSAIESQNNTIKKMPPVLDINFFKSGTINHQASLFKRTLFAELGLYPEQYRLASDYWLYLKSLAHDKVFTYLNYPLVKYDLSGVSVSSFEKYRKEMQAIWASVLPKIVQDISKRNDELEVENQELKSTLQYKLVGAAVRLNGLYQQLKFRF